MIRSMLCYSVVKHSFLPMIKVFTVVVPFLYIPTLSHLLYLLRPAIAGFDVINYWLFLAFKSPYVYPILSSAH